MKKLLFAVTALTMTFGLASVAHAKVERVNGYWKLNAPKTITFVCDGHDRDHRLDEVDNDSDGTFDGKGHYVADGDYKWDIDGRIAGNWIYFTIDYTGKDDDYKFNAIGVIHSDGSVHGITNGKCEKFEMKDGSATYVELSTEYKNHGQYVRSQENKREAAHSRIGMPVQSKGHLKLKFKMK